MPAAYKEAQHAVKKQLSQQWTREPLVGPLHLHLIVFGEGRGDADNIAGALMDSAQGILWADDRVNVIPSLSIEWHRSKKTDSHWIVHICLIDDTM